MVSRLDRSWQALKRADLENLQETNKLLEKFPLQKRTVPEFLANQARKYGAKTLWRCGEFSLTYAQAPREAAASGNMLSQLGVTKGDRVAILVSNRPEFLQIFLGCAWIGAVAVPLNIASRGQQLEHMLGNCGARVLFIEEDCVSVFDSIDAGKLALKEVVVLGDSKQGLPTDLTLRKWISPEGQIDAATLSPADPLSVLFTSGTTGPSKGVVCPHGQFFWWSVLTARQMGITHQDVLHTSLPLFHVNALGCFFQALLFGATQVVTKRFSVRNFWSDISKDGATLTYLLGAMVPMLLSKPEQDAEASHSVRAALAPGVPEEFHAPFMKRSAIVLLDGYGSTETNAVIGCDVHNYRAGTMGQAKPGIDARVVDEFDQPVPDGTPGELLLRADEPFCFSSGYHEMPKKSVEAWRNLWFHTGDRVVRSKDGYFNFIDRAKDSIRRRGENISSFEVEQVLFSHPDIAIAAVFPVQSELGEDEVMASVVLAPGANLGAEDIIRFCEGKMAYYCIPRFVDIALELPRTENGKIQKFKLRERGRTDETWDREAAGVKVSRD